MGQYVITVIGQGPHGNEAHMSGSDADVLAKKFVEELKARGQRIFDASFVSVAGEGERQTLEE